jgi:hypothetical protein
MSFLTLSLPKEAASFFASAVLNTGNRVDCRQAAAAAKIASARSIEKRRRRRLSNGSPPLLKPPATAQQRLATAA